MEHLAYAMTIVGVITTTGSLMKLIDLIDNPKMSKKKPHSCGNSHAVRRVSK